MKKEIVFDGCSTENRTKNEKNQTENFHKHDTDNKTVQTYLTFERKLFVLFLFSLHNFQHTLYYYMNEPFESKKNIAHPSLSSQWSAATNKKGISNEFILLKNSIQKKKFLIHLPPHS